MVEGDYELLLGSPRHVVILRMLDVLRVGRSARVMRIGPYVIKKGLDVYVEEAYSSIHASKLGIPTPQVLSVFRRGKMTYIITRRIRGAMLTESWKSMTPKQREIALSDVRRYVSIMRRDTSSLGRVSSVLGSGMFDQAMYERRWLSHDSVQGFVSALLDGVDSGPKDVEVGLNSSKAVNFTHGDLSPNNIMVRRGRVVSVIDWEFSGYRPDYWEVAKMGYPRLRAWPWYSMLSDYYPESREGVEAFNELMKHRSPM